MFTQLIKWSQQEYQHLPWRLHRTPYTTLVSEIMLQQTTVGTVKNHFDRFLKTFPDLESLTLASEAELLVAWKGLGYYRRARNLKKIATGLIEQFQGDIPLEAAVLQEIPGIGPYTANALLAIGMDRRALAIDANLERVLARVFALSQEKGPKLQVAIAQLLSSHPCFKQKMSYRALNEALMDLGRTFCQARTVSCGICPMKKHCLAFQTGQSLQYPVSKEKAQLKQQHDLHLLRVYIIKKNKLLVYKKAEGEWLSGQYEVPTFIISSTDPKMGQYPKLPPALNPVSLKDFKSSITKYKIKNSLYLMPEKDFKKLGFALPLEWREMTAADANFSTATMKGLAHLF